ncbi:MAG TPA: phosphoenolpyruvate--protein phosphotransferase, partial [Planctomycetota bacterium]|nr:phosphoenolpyruvate--protein phosphotransferase [Planctomycetota bacterium]
MLILKGFPVSPGIFIGEAFVFEGEEGSISERFIAGDAIPAELHRFDEAVKQVITDLGQLRDSVQGQLGASTAMIFEAHMDILKDPRIRKDVARKVETNLYSAEYATTRVFRALRSRFQSIDNEILASRADDIDDIRRRLLAALRGDHADPLQALTGEVCVCSINLAPSQTARFDKSHVKALVTEVGGRTSHTAILARGFGIPAVVGIEELMNEVAAGDTVIVDGNTGVVVIDPDEKALQHYKEQQAEFLKAVEAAGRDRALPIESPESGHVSVLGNIEFPEEAAEVIDQGGEGIGLFRTEFLYLRQRALPTEDEHYAAYVECLKNLKGNPLTIRTLDVGADKVIEEKWVEEPNPFLGCRSIRVSMRRPDVFRVQVRAVLRAAAIGRIKIMVPMITAVHEMIWARTTIQSVAEELAEQKIAHNSKVPIGAMIEVPSAALCCDLLAPHCDFFAIGTNDLTMYAMAVDRGNEHVADLCTPANPALLRLVQKILADGKQYKVPVCMCGEMAGDPLYAPLLLGMGLREYSVGSHAVPLVKQLLRHVT